MDALNRIKFLEDIAKALNKYLIEKEQEPVVFAANFKNFVVNKH